MSAKDFFERSDGELREGMKHAVTGEKAIGNEGMDVRVKVEVRMIAGCAFSSPRAARRVIVRLC